MDKKCKNYGSSWCIDFECEDCPVENIEEIANKDKHEFNTYEEFKECRRRFSFILGNIENNTI